MEDDKFAVYQEIRDYIETKIIDAKFSLRDKSETVALLSEDIPKIVTDGDD